MEFEFFCENCGSPVPKTQKKCPKCGQQFAGIKCPACLFEGAVEDFVSGCPHCHYQPNVSSNPLSFKTTTRKNYAFITGRRLWTLVGILFIAICLISILYLL